MPPKSEETRKLAHEETRKLAHEETRKLAHEETRKLAHGDEPRKRQPGFEERLERLEQLAKKLREGSIPLDEAVLLFEEGMKLSKSLEKDLSRVERRVEILTREPESDQEEPGLELFPELSEDDTQ
jgi:exodeoxyribonuclease VII small subunit